MMGTFGIIRQLIEILRTRSNPIYRRAAPTDPQTPPRLTFIALCTLLTVVFAGFFTMLQFSNALKIPDRFHSPLDSLDAILCVLTILWAIPLAALVGQHITRERTANTWETLLLTPQPPRTLLLANAAATLRPVAGMLGFLLFCLTFLRIGFALVSYNTDQTFSTPQIPLSYSAGVQALLAAACIVISSIDFCQMLALTVAIGLNEAVRAEPPSNAPLRALIGGLLAVFVPFLVNLGLIRALPSELIRDYPINAAALGPGYWLFVAPVVPTLSLILILFAAREAITRIVFRSALTAIA